MLLFGKLMVEGRKTEQTSNAQRPTPNVKFRGGFSKADNCRNAGEGAAGLSTLKAETLKLRRLKTGLRSKRRTSNAEASARQAPDVEFRTLLNSHRG
jgi:hypothetical protein